MLKYVIRRLLLLIPIMIGVILIVFTIMDLTPGDPARMILGQNANPESIRMLQERLGLDQPFHIRFSRYVVNVFRLDFGLSYRNQEPVFDEIIRKFPNTVKLAISAIILSSIIGISLGIFSAVKQYSPGDTMATLGALFFASIPNFWFGMSIMLLFALTLRILPSHGVDTWRHFILPIITVSLPSSAAILRLTRSTMLETIRQDYIRTAQAKGVDEKVVILRHALKNALLPVITSLGMTFGILLGGAIVTETVFAIPGLGTHIVDAIRMKDTPVVLASTIFLSAFFCVIMIIVDLLYAFIDPRIKAKYSR